ncbi:MAG: hypothetical protein AAGA69_12505, partial [Pseudomonadota bacterium]
AVRNLPRKSGSVLQAAAKRQKPRSAGGSGLPDNAEMNAREARPYSGRVFLCQLRDHTHICCNNQHNSHHACDIHCTVHFFSWSLVLVDDQEIGCADQKIRGLISKF